MIILCVARGHNGSTTLMVDGEIVFYLEEERLTRFKYDGSPMLGILKAFEYGDHIDHLVVCHTHRSGPNLDWTGEHMYEGFVRKLARKKWTFETTYIDLNHHEMHAACGFYNSGFESAACVIADGAGSFLQMNEVPDTLYELSSNLPPACKVVKTISIARLFLYLGWKSTGIPLPLSFIVTKPSFL